MRRISQSSISVPELPWKREAPLTAIGMLKEMDDSYDDTAIDKTLIDLILKVEEGAIYGMGEIQPPRRSASPNSGGRGGCDL